MNLADVELLEERLRQAMLTRDVPALDALLSDRLRFVNLAGDIVGKQADLDAHRSGTLRLSTMTPSDRHIELLGEEVALVDVVMDLAGTYGGTPFAGLFRYIRVWQQEDGRCRAVAGHVCAIQNPPA